jgi:hypothetical protein
MLDLNKLENTIPRHLLLTLPLDNAKAAAPSYCPYPSHSDRTQLGVKELMTWRAEQAEESRLDGPCP